MIVNIISKSQGSVVSASKRYISYVKKSRKLSPKKTKICTAKLIDGKNEAKNIRLGLKHLILNYQQQVDSRVFRPPKLGYVLVGNRSDSELYVKMKKRVCNQLGISTTDHTFSKNVSQDEILEYIHHLNEDPTVDGILTQLPMPDHINESALYDSIAHSKDVDGIHPLNMAAMARHEDPLFTPWTPKGVLHLIKTVWPEIMGKKVTVVGRSNIVGMPISMLLQKEFATVTLCHAHTQNLKEEVQTADIVISATGWPHLITSDFIKPGATVIDVGTKYIKDSNSPKGKKLVGDVHFEGVKNVAGYLTPVPGGVGPMTIAMLMDNIVLAYKRNLETQLDIKLNDNIVNNKSVMSMENSLNFGAYNYL